MVISRTIGTDSRKMALESFSLVKSLSVPAIASRTSFQKTLILLFILVSRALLIDAAKINDCHEHIILNCRNDIFILRK